MAENEALNDTSGAQKGSSSYKNSYQEANMNSK